MQDEARGRIKAGSPRRLALPLIVRVWHNEAGGTARGSPGTDPRARLRRRRCGRGDGPPGPGGPVRADLRRPRSRSTSTACRSARETEATRFARWGLPRLDRFFHMTLCCAPSGACRGRGGAPARTAACRVSLGRLSTSTRDARADWPASRRASNQDAREGPPRPRRGGATPGARARAEEADRVPAAPPAAQPGALDTCVAARDGARASFSGHGRPGAWPPALSDAPAHLARSPPRSRPLLPRRRARQDHATGLVSVLAFLRLDARSPEQRVRVEPSGARPVETAALEPPT